MSAMTFNNPSFIFWAVPLLPPLGASLIIWQAFYYRSSQPMRSRLVIKRDNYTDLFHYFYYSYRYWQWTTPFHSILLFLPIACFTLGLSYATFFVTIVYHPCGFSHIARFSALPGRHCSPHFGPSPSWSTKPIILYVHNSLVTLSFVPSSSQVHRP